MSTYCECGHVLAEHIIDDLDEADENPGPCYADGCECEVFEEIPADELDRGYD